MTTNDLRAAITDALRRRDSNADLDVTPSVTILGSRTSTAAVVLYGPDGAVIDVVARASDDALALRCVAFAVGLREDGGDPVEECARLTRERDEALARVDQLLGVVGCHTGEVTRLQFAIESEAHRHEQTRAVVREHLAAVDSLASARRSYLSATIGSESVTTGEIVRRHDAMVAAEERVREAERRLRARVDGDR